MSPGPGPIPDGERKLFARGRTLGEGVRLICVCRGTCFPRTATAAGSNAREAVSRTCLNLNRLFHFNQQMTYWQSAVIQCQECQNTRWKASGHRTSFRHGNRVAGGPPNSGWRGGAAEIIPEMGMRWPRNPRRELPFAARKLAQTCGPEVIRVQQS
jgi:hypothetical protein